MAQMVLEAKPGSISIDPSKAAVIVVDMQNDFGSKGGMFDRAGIDISGIQNAVAPTARILASARRAGMAPDPGPKRLQAKAPAEGERVH